MSDIDVILLDIDGQVVTIPTGAVHGVAACAEFPDGGWFAVCVCSSMRCADTEDGVRALLDAHITGAEVN